ncbi:MULTISPECIES: flavodoxin family protein [Actinosynnema]|uniref:flavodoxin family protein n=1 Tax=Actinosynnema TaxID=40566 RepID=UPI0035584086
MMVQALVVYESMFGNNRALAEAIAEAVGGVAVEVGVAPEALPPEVDLLFVGAPTHALTLSSDATRWAAATEHADGPLVSGGRSMREWLANLTGAEGVAAHPFGTHVKVTWPPSSAARSIGKKLRALGCVVGEPKSFKVTGFTGPFAPGEVDRAKAWARTALSGAPAR